MRGAQCRQHDGSYGLDFYERLDYRESLVACRMWNCVSMTSSDSNRGAHLVQPLTAFVSSAVIVIVNTAWLSRRAELDVVTVAMINAVGGVCALASFALLVVRGFSYFSIRDSVVAARPGGRYLSLAVAAVITNAGGVYYCGFTLCGLLVALNAAVLLAWLIADALGRRDPNRNK